MKIWAIQTEVVNNQEAQLLLWPHFWVNEEKAKFQNAGTFLMAPGSTCLVIGRQTNMQEFVAILEEMGPIRWKEEFYKFTPLKLI